MRLNVLFGIVGFLGVLTTFYVGWNIDNRDVQFHYTVLQYQARERMLHLQLEALRKQLSSCTQTTIHSEEAEFGGTSWLSKDSAQVVDEKNLVSALLQCQGDLQECHLKPVENISGRDSTIVHLAASVLQVDPEEGKGGSEIINSSALGVSACPWLLETAVRDIRLLRSGSRDRELLEQNYASISAVATSVLAAQLREPKGGCKKQVKGLGYVINESLKQHTSLIVNFLSDAGFPPDQSDVTAIRNDVEKKIKEEAARLIREDEQNGFAVEQMIDEADGVLSLNPGLDSENTCIGAVIPFRSRAVHLDMFFEHMARFLQEREAHDLCWHFYIVEQYDSAPFNRGWLFNVGLAMAELAGVSFSCIAIQDLDTLPEIGAGVDYSACKVPRQLSAEIECYGWLPPYADNTGGVVTMRPSDWYTINGFSNDFVGWGGEDDDLRLRLLSTHLLLGTCGDYCELESRGFHRSTGQQKHHKRKSQKLIERPPRGKGRFICLDEQSHTARKHGNKKNMKQLLDDMRAGSDRWVYDGLSNLRFKLLQHKLWTFPNATNAKLHWLKVAGVENKARLTPERLRLVLANGSCSEACVQARRCSSAPTRLPFSMADLRLEISKVLGGCLYGAAPDTIDAKVGQLSYWLMDRTSIVLGLPANSDIPGHGELMSPRFRSGSWAFGEAVREALDQRPYDGVALVIRAVPSESYERVREGFRRTVERLQKPIVHVCTGTAEMNDGEMGSLKQSISVGSDDCEVRGWTHQSSFRALRSPRTAKDTPVCVGEAPGTWTSRIVKGSTDCAGMDVGINWTHKGLFYIGDDAEGKLLCVRYRKEKRPSMLVWSRWEIESPTHGRTCGVRHGWDNSFHFRSMMDTFISPLTQLCVTRGHVAKMWIGGCEGKTKDHSSELSAINVIRPQHAVALGSEVWCFKPVINGHCLVVGESCNQTGEESFTLPPNASGKAWCVGEALSEANHSAENSITTEVTVSCMIEPRVRCDGKNSRHVLGFREVALEDIGEELGLLSTASL